MKRDITVIHINDDEEEEEHKRKTIITVVNHEKLSRLMDLLVYSCHLDEIDHHSTYFRDVPFTSEVVKKDYNYIAVCYQSYDLMYKAFALALGITTKEVEEMILYLKNQYTPTFISSYKLDNDNKQLLEDDSRRKEIRKLVLMDICPDFHKRICFLTAFVRYSSDIYLNIPNLMRDCFYRYREEQETTERKYCIICMERNRDTIIIPCNHVISCSTCNNKHNYKQCPMCQTDIKSMNKIYM
jgi:hypothetical protein